MESFEELYDAARARGVRVAVHSEGMKVVRVSVPRGGGHVLHSGVRDGNLKVALDEATADMLTVLGWGETVC